MIKYLLTIFLIIFFWRSIIIKKAFQINHWINLDSNLIIFLKIVWKEFNLKIKLRKIGYKFYKNAKTLNNQK